MNQEDIDIINEARAFCMGGGIAVDTVTKGGIVTEEDAQLVGLPEAAGQPFKLNLHRLAARMAELNAKLSKVLERNATYEDAKWLVKTSA